MNNELELLKPFTNRVAELCASGDSAQAVRMLRQLGLLGAPPAASAGQASASGIIDQAQPQSPRRVGIWEPKVENGRTVFVRSKDLAHDWHLWANVGRIEPKSDRKRVVFIGESVARGFLYDPQFTPAMALEGILQSRLGEEAVEVIDLARTNIGFEVRDVAAAALSLEPDLTIIFSGNNWDKVLPKNIPAVDTLLSEQGAAGFKALLERELYEQADRVVQEISELYRVRGIPLLWILPEFNLGDWRDPLTNAPYLREGQNEEWIRLRQAAEEALAADDSQRASNLALRMVDLDEGTCVTEFYLLAECARRGGDRASVRRYLELARDAAICDTSKNISPRTYSATERVLRLRTQSDPDGLVDLPAIFKEYLEGDVPGRRLFVDYCHLSSEGIQVAMSAAASRALLLLGGLDITYEALMQDCPLPTPQVEGETAFLAAIHNAHWWQSYGLVHYYCAEAVRRSPDIASLMTRFVDVQTRRAPILMCESTEEIAGLGSPLMQHYLLRFNYQRMDSLLLDAITDSLGERGVPVRNMLRRLRKEEHSVTYRDTNLLDYYYCSEGSQQEVMWVVPHLGGYLNHKTNHYYKAFWLESRFAFVADAFCPVRLALTCRLPEFALAEATLAISANGRPVAKAEITQKWQTWDIFVPPEFVVEGLNQLTLHWPIPIFPGLKAYAPVAGHLMEKLYPEFFCVFGEIHSFWASDARRHSTLLDTETQVSIMEMA